MANRTSFKPGRSGNPAGRARGSRNKASLAVDALLEGEADAITRKAIELAKDGDPVALRMCLDRIAPVRRERPIEFAMPAVRTAADAIEAHATILAGTASGELSPSEAADLARLVDGALKAIEVGDLAERIARLEAGR